MSAAEAMHRLYEIVPKDAHLDLPPEVAVEYGEPAERIVEFAKQRGADLIVMGVRSAPDASERRLIWSAQRAQGRRARAVSRAHRARLARIRTIGTSQLTGRTFQGYPFTLPALPMR